MPTTDYSKWEGMRFDDDDDDGPRRPRVTKLEGPSKITVGDDGDHYFAAAEASRVGASTSASAPHTTIKPTSGPAVKRDGLDYQKWDNLVVDDSDEEMEDAGEDAEMGAYPAGDAAEAEDELTAEELNILRQRIRKDEAPASASGHTPAPPPADAVAARHDALVARLTRNGAWRDGYLWRQTESEVELSIVLPAGTRAKMLSIELLPSDLGHAQQRLRVGWKSHGLGGVTGVAFERALAYPVEEPLGEEQGEKEELLWELCDFETAAQQRLLRVSMRKREVHGIVVWWSRALEGEEELDTQTLPDRRRADKLPAQQNVWEEANRLFKERVAAREKIMIDPSQEFLEAASEGEYAF